MSEIKVGIIMGSDSDLDVMSKVAKQLDEFGVGYEVQLISAHRTPEEMMEYAAGANDRGIQVIIAGAGGSAHLPGMIASHTILPVLAVPVKRDNHDHEALWSNIKMPRGIPLATMPENGSENAALMAVRILAINDPELTKKYTSYIEELRQGVLNKNAKLKQIGWEHYLSQG
jgi:5-(carboxyamino)imidazole ribonucleotide mutase